MLFIDFISIKFFLFLYFKNVIAINSFNKFFLLSLWFKMALPKRPLLLIFFLLDLSIWVNKLRFYLDVICVFVYVFSHIPKVEKMLVIMMVRRIFFYWNVWWIILSGHGIKLYTIILKWCCVCMQCCAN